MRTIIETLQVGINMNGQFYQQLIQHISDGVYYVDRSKNITFWNQAAERITGYSSEEVMSSQCSDNILRHIDDSGTELCLFGCPVGKTLADGNIRSMDVYLHHKQGHRVPVSVRVSPIADDSGKIIGAVEVFCDRSRNSDLLQQLSDLKKEVFLDKIAQVGNRKFAEANLQKRLEEMESYGVPFGVLFLDIDYFKKFNDTYGHNTGDRVLAMVAKTMSNVLRNMDMVARWGGEEFVVIIPNVNVEVLHKIAERIRVFIEKSWLNVNNENLKVTVSIGGAMAREKEEIELLIERADNQMYESKKRGRNCVSIED